ncbi:MAG: hypothetical protein RMY29_031080 [Nostoc sp. CreGUA01]|nr:hypothetical protein [Nostoc sp. CreGUA01]
MSILLAVFLKILLVLSEELFSLISPISPTPHSPLPLFLKSIMTILP